MTGGGEVQKDYSERSFRNRLVRLSKKGKCSSQLGDTKKKIIVVGVKGGVQIAVEAFGSRERIWKGKVGTGQETGPGI